MEVPPDNLAQSGSDICGPKKNNRDLFLCEVLRAIDRAKVRKGVKGGHDSELSGMGKGNVVVQCLWKSFFLVELRNGILESQKFPDPSATALVASPHRRPNVEDGTLSPLHPSNRTRLVPEEERVSKSLCHLSWSKVGLDIALLDITQHVNRASVSTAYAWYTGVIKRKASRAKKMAGGGPPKR